ncbi:MAG: T9SS type A sorting domain-containing protein [Chitinophagaceae bacterium]|nr:T9SS type A sorting domain-containing protein [Chitinophagaceae bacterium]
MQNKFFFLSCLICLTNISVFSQKQDLLAPLVHDIPRSSNFYTQVKLFEDYWKDKDKTEQGCGYKPFMRWKEYWQNSLLPDSTLPTSEQQIKKWEDIQQASKKTRAVGSNWVNIGPNNNINEDIYNGAGRINIVRVDPNNDAIIYVGTANGGLWKSTDTGNNWMPLTDTLPTIGISGIAIDSNNSNVIYISTGDQYINNCQSSGVYKSINGGMTWTKCNIPFTGSYISIGEINIDPNNSNNVYLIGKQGLFKSTDAGFSWTQLLNHEVKEMRFQPNNSNTIYIIRSYSGYFGISKSTDGGLSFFNLNTPQLLQRSLIDVTQVNPNVVYIFCAPNNTSMNTIVYKSSDAGLTFDTMGVHNYTCTQSMIDMAFCVSPYNENELYYGCLYTYKSINGGQTFTSMGGITNVHADIQEIILQNGILYIVSDGGIYVSKNYGSSFETKNNNLAIGQFYRLDLAQSTSNIIAGGLQDNGSWYLNNNQWHGVYGGDGMNNAINPLNTNFVYGFIQNAGILFRYHYNTNNIISATYPPAGEFGVWVAPLEYGIDSVLYAGFNKFIYRLDVATNTWIKISTTQAISRTIETDPVNPNRLIYFAGDSLRIMHKIGLNYFVTKAISQNLVGGYVTSISFNEMDSNVIYLCTFDEVYYTNNAGNTWININKNLTLNNEFNAIAHQKGSLHNSLYLATNNTVYYTNDTMSIWEPYNNLLPNTKITDLEINTNEGFIVASTYGRGVFKSPLAINSIATIYSPSQNDKIYFYPNPCSENLFLSIEINEPVQIKFYDLLGNLIFQKEMNKILSNTPICISNLNNGIYIIDIISKNHLIRKKIEKID